MGSKKYARYRDSVRFLESLLTLEPDRLISKVDSTVPGGPVGLRRCRRLLEYLGNPQNDLRFVHVGGTSGKGSVVRMVHEILHRAGVRVGSYVSPHVTTALERISVGASFVPLGTWLECVADLKGLVEQEYMSGPFGVPSYHELVMAIALLAFRRLGCEIVVLEVGIGGRLDSTNVISSPLVAVITDVGKDHTELLGQDLRTIARDKAGIIKPGTTAIVGAGRQAARDEILARAKQVGVPVWLLGNELALELGQDGFLVRTPEGHVAGLRSRLDGRHQQRNAALAVATALSLRRQGVTLDADAIRSGIGNAFLPGRFERVRLAGNGLLVLDIAHNVDKVRALVDTWSGHFGQDGAAVVSVAENKDIDGVLEALGQGFRKLVVTRPLASHRKMASPLLLARKAEALFAEVTIRLDPVDAVSTALRTGKGLALVAGSTYLVSEVRRRFDGEEAIVERGRVLPLDGEFATE